MVTRSNRYTLAVVTTVAMFATWGLAQRIHGSLSPQFEHLFALTTTQITLARSALGVAYFFLAIPSALLLRRLGYKAGLVFGLSGFAFGALLLYPAIERHEFLYYLAAAITIGGSWALLETCANPLIVQMGPPETAVRRLNFAQSFYPIGIFAGIWLSPQLAFSELPLPGLSQDVVRPYVIMGLCVLLLAYLVDHIEFPPVATMPSAKSARAKGEIRALLSRPGFPAAVAALASYILAQSCIWATISHFARFAPLISPFGVADVFLCAWVIFAVGRFIGTALLYVFDSDHLLAFCAAASCALLVLATAAGGLVALICLGVTCFFMSIMFPTVFASGIRDLGSLTKLGSGMLVMAGGLGVTIAAAVIALVASMAAIMILCSLCFAAVLAYALAISRAKKRRPSSAAPVVSEPPCS